MVDLSTTLFHPDSQKSISIFIQKLSHFLHNVTSQLWFIIFIQIQNILSIHFHSYSFKVYDIFILHGFPSRKKFKKERSDDVFFLSSMFLTFIYSLQHHLYSLISNQREREKRDVFSLWLQHHLYSLHILQHHLYLLISNQKERAKRDVFSLSSMFLTFIHRLQHHFYSLISNQRERAKRNVFSLFPCKTSTSFRIGNNIPLIFLQNRQDYFDSCPKSSFRIHKIISIHILNLHSYS